MRNAAAGPLEELIVIVPAAMAHIHGIPYFWHLASKPNQANKKTPIPAPRFTTPPLLSQHLKMYGLHFAPMRQSFKDGLCRNLRGCLGGAFTSKSQSESRNIVAEGSGQNILETKSVAHIMPLALDFRRHCARQTFYDLSKAPVVPYGRNVPATAAAHLAIMAFRTRR